MAYSQILEKYGNPAQQSGEAMKRRNSVSRLMELEQTHQQRADADAAMGPGRTSVTGATDYFQRLNDEGEQAGIQQTLAGRKPQVSHSYGGTDFAEGGMGRRPSMAALQPEQYDGPTDNLDYYGKLAAVQGRQVQNERQRNAEFEESTADDPVFAARRRDIHHADVVDEGAAQGEGHAAGYLAPGQSTARRQKTWDDEAYNQANGPFSSAAIRGQAELAKQREISERESQKALIGADARIGSQAMRSYGSVAASEANQGRDVSEARTDLRNRLPGAGGGGQARTASMAQVAQVAQSRGIPVDELRRYYESKGYVISDGGQ